MNELIDLLKATRPEADFTGSKNFIEDGLLDSFDVVAIVAALDKKYRISINGVDILPENFKSLEAIAALLRKHGVQP
jgi:acyl carrier protein